MSLTDRYIFAVRKRLPESRRDNVEKEIKKIIEDRIIEKGGYSQEAEEQVLQELGNPRLLADKYLDRKHYLIGPELYEIYLTILKIIISVTVAVTILGNTVDFLAGNENLLVYFAATIAAALNAAIITFGWITLVFAVLERKAKQEFLKEIQTDWHPKDLPEVRIPQKPFSKIGTIIGICFIILFMILVNGYSQFLGIYLIGNGSSQFIRVLNGEVFQSYLPYINGILLLQLLFTTSKLVFEKWTYIMAAANLIINILSLVLLIAILGNMNIIEPNFISLVSGLASGTENDLLRAMNFSVYLLKALFVLILVADSAGGFYNAYKNSR
jgi:hypothetical protein